jgi:hypothetical protein
MGARRHGLPVKLLLFAVALFIWLAFLELKTTNPF